MLALYMSAGPEQHAHGVQVVGHAGHDVAGAVALIETRVLQLQLAEEIVAQIELDVARDADENPALRVEKDAFDQEMATRSRAKIRISSRGRPFLDPVDGHAQNPGELHRDDIGGDARQRAPHVSPAVAAHVADRAGRGRRAWFYCTGFAAMRGWIDQRRAR